MEYLRIKKICDNFIKSCKKDNNLFVYSIPDDAGHYTAKLEGEFRWDEPDKNIKITAADIAKRKKIDMVIIDSEMYPTVEWGGVDMTKDMALAISTSSDKPSEGATPSGDEG